MLNLKLMNGFSPKEKELNFLGIYFDDKQSFNKHIHEIKTRCMNRINIIKILSNNKRGLSQNTLSTLYKSHKVKINYSFLFDKSKILATVKNATRVSFQVGIFNKSILDNSAKRSLFWTFNFSSSFDNF